MGTPATVRTSIRILTENDFLDTGYAKLCHQREVPSQCLTQRAFDVDLLAHLLARMHREHSAYFDEVRKRRRDWSLGTALSVDVRGHLIEVVETDHLRHQVLKVWALIPRDGRGSGHLSRLLRLASPVQRRSC